MELTSKFYDFISITKELSGNEPQVEITKGLEGRKENQELEAVGREIKKLFLEEDLEYLDCKRFFDHEKKAGYNKQKSFTKSDKNSMPYAISPGYSCSEVIDIARDKISKIQSVIQKTDTEIYKCAFLMGFHWLVSTDGIKFYDSATQQKIIIWHIDQVYQRKNPQHN